jgi:hypothetical protein
MGRLYAVNAFKINQSKDTSSFLLGLADLDQERFGAECSLTRTRLVT